MSLRGNDDAPRQRPPWRTEEVLTDDGTTIAAYRLGPAPSEAAATVVIAHGWTLTAAAWDGVAQRLVASRPDVALVAYDQRGHGSSQPGSASATMALLAADLTAVASASAPTGPLVLVGHSMGGMALLVAAGAEPSLLADRPSALLLCSTTAGGPRWLGTKARAAPLMQALALLPPHLHVRRVPNRVLARVSYAPDTALDVVAGTNAAMGVLSLRSVGAWFGAFNAHDASDVLPALAAAGSEVTVVVGDADRLTPLENSLALTEALPDARLRVVPGTGHMLFVERPDVVAEEIVALVDHVTGRGRRPR